ncbi:MAG TPA: carbohydrate kinase family protein [Thermoanaerobacterales bacterium]|nr:carbohydrate kinase family protein [Thermoanaerobacterales bacterium]
MGKYVVAIGPNAIDEYYRCDNWPKIGDKCFMEYIKAVPGGMIQNAASIMAGYGMTVYSLDILGKDEYTSVILDDLKSHGVQTDYMDICDDIKNTKTYIILSEDERTIFIVSNKKPKISIDDRKKDLLFGSSYVYTTIKDMKNVEDDINLIKQLKSQGVKIFFDVENESFDDPEKDSFYFENANVLVFNESGFEKYRGEKAPEEIYKDLFAKGVEIIVTTLGSKGCVVRTPNWAGEFSGIKVDVKDTTGAGDTFNATFLYGLLEGWSIEKAAKYANFAAARSIMYFGPKGGIAPIKAIEEFIKKYE